MKEEMEEKFIITQHAGRYRDIVIAGHVAITFPLHCYPHKNCLPPRENTMVGLTEKTDGSWMASINFRLGLGLLESKLA